VQILRTFTVISITLPFVIEMIALPGRRTWRILILSVHSGAHQVPNPGKSDSNHLLPSLCETIALSLAKPRRHGYQCPSSAPTNLLAGVFSLGGDPFAYFACKKGIDLLRRSRKTRRVCP